MDQGMAEGQLDGTAKPDSPAARAILHRILMQHTGLLATHGPEKVMNAVDEVADYIGDVEEIGSSDVSGWVRHVEQMLGNMTEQGVAEEGSENKYSNLSNRGVNRGINRAGDDFKRMLDLDQAESPHYKTQHQQDTKQRLKTKPMAGPKGVLPEQGVAEGPLNEAATMASVSKLLRHIERHHPTWFDDYGMGEVEDTVVDMVEQGVFSGMTVVNAAALVGKELESMYGADAMNEAEYQGRKVPLGKPMQGDVKKSKVYVKDPKTGNVKKVNFGDPNMSIKKSNPERRKSFRARHNCDNPGPRTSARYWSCRAW
jgi:hypothetical protein